MTNAPWDTLIVGGGLAGACAALHLSRRERVLLLEADHLAAGASGVAAGLVNPLMARQARSVWRMEEALEAMHETLHLADAHTLFRATGVLRPAADAGQASRFKATAAQRAAHATWIAPAEAGARFPAAAAPHGALLVHAGGAVPVPAFVAALLAAARRNGAEVRTGVHVSGWEEDDTGACVTVHEGSETGHLQAGRIVLALGGVYTAFPELAVLHLHRIKGQTVRLAAPGLHGLDNLPPLAGTGYIVPDGDTLVVGSSYEHTYADLHPSPEQTHRLLQKARQMLPGLAEVTVLEEKAGVRVTVPHVRLPMIGPLPGRTRIWIFTGLGSKGLLMAPLLARRLPQFFARPEAIPPEVQVRRADR